MPPDAGAGAAPRYVFVLGTGRCGSTLVQEVLARHEQAGFVSNVEDIAPMRGGGRWNSLLYRRVPPALTQKGRLRYAPSEAYRALDREVSPILSTPFRDLRADDVTPWLHRRLHEFFDSRAQAQGRPVFLHKFTGWPRSGLLDAVFPGARFINIVRDGRAVANSWLQMPWWLGYRGPESWQWGPLPDEYRREWERSDRSFALLAGLLWKLLMDAFREARDRLPAERWLELRYEDVVADPRARFAEMLEFMELPWSPTFEAGFARHSFSSGRGDAFRRDLDATSVELLTASLREHLERYGYPTTQP